jgi:hypothetical protein
MISTPSDVTICALLNAKLKELQFWVKQANSQASSKVLTSQGTVKTLCKKLAVYYELDLNTTSSTLKSETIIISLISMDFSYNRSSGSSSASSGGNGRRRLLLACHSPRSGWL